VLQGCWLEAKAALTSVSAPEDTEVRTLTETLEKRTGETMRSNMGLTSQVRYTTPVSQPFHFQSVSLKAITNIYH